MALLGYKPQFIPPLCNNIKTGTIRNKRKIPIKVGERLYMYTGLRTKKCTRIGTAICTGVNDLRIIFAPIGHHRYPGILRIQIWAGDDLIADHHTCKQLKRFAVRDGFSDRHEMSAFWIKTHGKFDFNGDYIQHGRVDVDDHLPANLYLKPPPQPNYSSEALITIEARNVREYCEKGLITEGQRLTIFDFISKKAKITSSG